MPLCQVAVNEGHDLGTGAALVRSEPVSAHSVGNALTGCPGNGRSVVLDIHHHSHVALWYIYCGAFGAAVKVRKAPWFMVTVLPAVTSVPLESLPETSTVPPS